VEVKGSASSLQNWEILSRREVADGRPWLRLWAEDVQLPDGRVVESFFTVEMPDYVVVVALTPEGRVVVERNYKHGPRRVCLNLPAGYVEQGEDPLEPDAGDLEEMEIGLMGLDEVLDAVRRGDVAVLSVAAAIGLAVAAQSADWEPLTGEQG
jgi:hypothetical protein